MAFSTKSISDAVLSILSDNNTTTSSTDLSASLASRVVTIQHGNGNFPILNTQYPAVLVMPVSKSEDGDQIGRAQRRTISTQFEIYGLTMRSDSRTNADMESIILADNIEACLRQYINLSSTVDTTNLSGTTWSVGKNDQAFVNISTTQLQTRSFART